MKKYIRFEIITEDRVGVAFKVLEQIYRANIDLNSVEVFSKKIYIKMEDIDERKKEGIKENILKIEDVISIREIELLSYEKNERKLLAVINSIDEGIISVNKELKIEIFNNYCEEVFHYKSEEVRGLDIRRLIGENAPLVDLIRDGKNYDNIELHIKNDRGESHYITTGRPIKDDNDRTIGGAASIKDMKKAIELVKVVNSIKEGAFRDIVGNSRALDGAKKMALAVARGDSTVLLRGESGTGKELFAKAIHNLSERSNNRFVTLNCAALPDNLVESELFGYEKGSFTGALNNGRDGLFKEAHGGTLFLDEIGELSLPLQAKLLRVLQEGVIRKIGSTSEEAVDVRIIAATNRNLEDMVHGKLFREDLYYRINVIPVNIPPLRERIEDMPVLVRFFMDRLNKRLRKNIISFDMEFMDKLMKYDWPGNVRELQNVVERAMILSEGGILSCEHLNINASQDKMEQRDMTELKSDLKLNDIVEDCERKAIIKALQKYKSLRKTAKALGVSHTTIMNKISKYQIKL